MFSGINSFFIFLLFLCWIRSSTLRLLDTVKLYFSA
nr:MAG TPA: hypothetical protein [Caudoviricetes sp.]